MDSGLGACLNYAGALSLIRSITWYATHKLKLDRRYLNGGFTIADRNEAS